MRRKRKEQRFVRIADDLEDPGVVANHRQQLTNRRSDWQTTPQQLRRLLAFVSLIGEPRSVHFGGLIRGCPAVVEDGFAGEGVYRRRSYTPS